MTSLFIALLLTATHAAIIDEPLHPFGYQDRLITNGDTLFEVAHAVKTPRAAAELRKAASKRGNGDHVFGLLIDRIPDLGARERFVQRFGVAHPIFGSLPEMRRLPSRFRRQLLAIAHRGVPLEDVATVKNIWTNRSEAGLDQFQEIIEAKYLRNVRDGNRWKFATEIGRQSCSRALELVADIRRNHRDRDRRLDSELADRIIRTTDQISSYVYLPDIAYYFSTYAQSRLPEFGTVTAAEVEARRTAYLAEEADFATKLEGIKAEIAVLEQKALPKNVIRLVRLRVLDARVLRLQKMLAEADAAVDRMMIALRKTKAMVAEFESSQPFNLLGGESAESAPFFREFDPMLMRDLDLEKSLRAQIEALRIERVEILKPSTI